MNAFYLYGRDEMCHGANCKVQDSEGETVLHKAVKVRRALS